MPQNSGSFGSIVTEGNKITIEPEPDSIGDVSITTAVGRIQCFWDGTQWVCASIGFSQSQNPDPSQAYSE